MAKSKTEFLGLTKALQKIAGRHQFSNVFDDFMQMAICAFSMGRMEDVYLKIAEKYSPEEMKIFGEALAEMINEYQNGMDTEGSWVDILGNVFEETNSSFSASGSGQFFTPDTVCNLMAQLTCGPEACEPEACEPEACEPEITINDCACGSGRNLIAHSRLHPKNRFNAFYVGQDLDRRCVNMSVLNLFMYGMRGIIIHMDTLAMKIFGGYRVYLADTLMGIAPISVNECFSYLTTAKEDVKEPAKIIDITTPAPIQMHQKLIQASLF